MDVCYSLRVGEEGEKTILICYYLLIGELFVLLRKILSISQRKSSKIETMNKQFLKWMSVFLLLLSGNVGAQVAVNSVVADTPVSFASTDFQMELAITMNLSGVTTSADVEIDLHAGIEYVANSAQNVLGVTNITEKAGSTPTKPIFTITGAANSTVTFKIKRKVTKAAVPQIKAGITFVDKIKATAGGHTTPETLANYKLNWPSLQIETLVGQTNAPVGVATKTFTIKNNAQAGGTTKDIYFWITYPAGVSPIQVVTPTGCTLTKIPVAGKELYKLTKIAGDFAGGESVTLTESYKVERCNTTFSIQYVVFWGASATDPYEESAPSIRSVSSGAVNTTIVQKTDAVNDRYFEPKNGLCGEVVGTSYFSFKNSSTDGSVAYNNKLLLSIGNANFVPDNVRIIAADGTKIQVPMVYENNNYYAKFENIPLSTWGGKDIGFTDEDNDGFADDLKANTVVRMCFDIKNKITRPYTCISKNASFTMNPLGVNTWEDSCGNAKEVRYNTGDILREFTVTDASSYPIQLVKNIANEGYLLPLHGSISSAQILYGQSSRQNNPLKYRYYAKLPQGVAMKNIRFYYTQDPTDTAAPSVAITDVPAGGTLSFTIDDNYPAGVAKDVKDYRKPGYIAYDLELTDCTGVGATGNLEFNFYILDKNSDNTWCEIPRICVTYPISMGCPTATCSVKGPMMLSTKVERADDSYGWTTVSMTTRVARSAVSAKQRRRALHLDNLEFISEGRQTTEQSTDNLYYYMAAIKTANLKPKFVKVTIAGNETTLQATDAGVVTTVTDASGNYYRWNLTNALPITGLAAGQTFTVVATYQVNALNPANNSGIATEAQSGITSYFYTLANKNDTSVNAKGVHNNQLHCGVDLIPVFNIVNTYTRFASNQYSLSGCSEVGIGAYMVFSGRTTAATDYFTDEYRPGRLIKKIKLKFPLAYQITQPVRYEYNATVADVAKNYGSKPQVLIPLSAWTMTIEGNRRVYTYTNPTNTSDPLYLPPGMVMARSNYAEYIRPIVQASCNAKDYKTYTGTDAQIKNKLIADGENAIPETEYEDYYYHYAQTPQSELKTEVINTYPLWYTNPPVLKMTPQGAGLGITATKAQQEARFSLEALTAPAPYTWVSIPDIQGIQIDALEEVTSAGAFVRTITHETSISGEKMYFLQPQPIQIGVTNQKYYRIKFTITNCNVTQQKLTVYTGWNCGSFPTAGYQQTCGKDFLDYTIQIVESKKQITALTTNTSTIQMCAPTNFGYEIKSVGVGDIADANLVIVGHTGIVINNVKIEYPLGSGTVYNTATPVNGKKIGVQTVGNKTTYVLSDILPNGILLGSLQPSTTEAQKTFKLTFDVSPNCDFTAGSSFDIDIEGKDFCGGQAKGDKTTAIIANIAGVHINDYSINLTPLAYNSGNANACDTTGALYKTRVTVNSSNPTYQVGANARLRFRIPEGYELVGTQTGTRTVASWLDPARIPSEDSNIGTEQEIVVKIPQGMQNNQYFEFGVYVRQKASALITCDTQSLLKVFATDETLNVPCPSQGNNCPKIATVTSPQQSIAIRNNRADLSFAEVQTTAVPQANKENITIKYKIANAATALAAYNGQLVVSLYNDINNNALVDAGEVLTTRTTTQALAANATSAVQSFTYLADQSQVCRLRLSIRNVDNKCLCDDKDVALPTPALGGNLVSDLTTCETASVTFAYNAAAPVYDAYTWSPASYLSATNIATPTFLYSDTKLTAPLTVTYTLTVKRTNGCESTQTVTVVVNPTTATPAPNAVNLCSGSTIQSLKSYLGGLVSGTVKVYATATAAAELANTTAITNNTTYYYSAQVTGQCESTRQAILVKIVATPNVLSNYTYCAGTKVAALWDQIDPADSDRLLRIYTAPSGGTPLDRNDLLQAGNYYVAKIAKNGNITCETPRAHTVVAIPTVATPTVSATPVLCPTAAAGSVSFAAYVTPATGNTLRWYATATATVPLTATPTISTQVTSITTQTAYVSQVTAAGCEGGRASITLVVKDVTPPTLNAPAPLVTNCHNAATNISTWLNSATATDNCGIVSLTNNYSAPADFCNVPNGTLTVTFVAKDLFGNTTTQTRTITLVSIKAENDTFTVTHGAVATTTTKTVLDNDKVGTQTATAATVSMTVVTPATGAAGSATPTLNADGTITVPAGTKSGTYTITYKICTKVVSLTVCDSATATIAVGAPEIKANTDTFTITNGASGGTTSSVLTNDSLNGHLNPSTTSVTLTWLTVPAGVQTHTDGTLTAPAGTASGTYTVTYSICEVLNPSNCSIATATIAVGAPEIKANTDTFTITNGATGGTTNSVLTNDSLNGHLNPSITSVTLTWLTVPAGVQTHTDGTLTVPAGTASGTYTVTYSICEVLNPSNCSTATATIAVGAPEIKANTDTFTITNGANGGTTNSVLTNDSLNGHLNPSTTSVTLTWLTVPIGVQTHTDGTLTVPAGTASGTYTVTYSICEKLNPSNCSTATATIVVHRTPAPIPAAANDEATTPINTPIVIDVLHNDTPHGTVTPHITTIPTKGTAVVNHDNTVTYTPNTNFVGIDTFVYEICNTDGVCVSATVTVKVTNGLTIYNAISISGNSQNDHFHIGGIENYPNNTVRIFNRWGVKVFDTEGYDNVRNVFKGFSNGRVTVEGSENLPQGTYYYIIKYIDENGQKESKVGWLYLKK